MSLGITEERIDEILENEAYIISVSDLEYDKLEQYYSFDCGIDEYNLFLKKQAKSFDDQLISKTHLLISKEDNDLIGYISLSADIINLTGGERRRSGQLSGEKQLPFKAISALKVGKLAISKKDKYRKKKYGAFLLAFATSTAQDINDAGCACRFVTVDADIEHREETEQYYIKYGFIRNNSADYKTVAPQNTSKDFVSMRRDIYEDIVARSSVDDEAM